MGNCEREVLHWLVQHLYHHLCGPLKLCVCVLGRCILYCYKDSRVCALGWGVRFVLLGGFRNAKPTTGQKPRHQTDAKYLAIPEAVLQTRKSLASNATEPP